MLTIILLFGGLAVLALIVAGVYFSGGRAKSAVVQKSHTERPKRDRAMGIGDD